ncbi:MAG: RluA family pseudouridine synthase [Pseudomonadota bacterium]
MIDRRDKDRVARADGPESQDVTVVPRPDDTPDRDDGEAHDPPVMVVAEDSHAGQRLDRFLAEHIEMLSRSRLQVLIRTGAVQCFDEVLIDPKRKVQAGDVFVVAVPRPEDPVPMGEPMTLDIVYEDPDLIVINKPAGLVVHPSAGHETGTLVNGLIAHCGEELSGIGGVRRPGIVHRLDKDTSGLLVVAKSDAAHQGLSAQFAAHGSDGQLHRAYVALCWGVPMHRAGRIEAPLGRSSINRLKMAVVSEQRGRFAATNFEVQDRLGRGMVRKASAGGGGPQVARDTRSSAASAPEILACEMQLQLETGRTHQIRVHLAHLGNPVIGDPLYALGFRSRSRRFEDEVADLIDATKRQMLHAAELGFTHPVTGEVLTFSRPPPDDYLQLKAMLNQT